LGCEQAADLMKNSTILKNCKINHQWTGIIYETPTGRQKKAIPGITETTRHLARLVNESLTQNNETVVIGGDHSCAIGTWSGLYAALSKHHGDKSDIGLIWVDAHLDAHTPLTSDTGNVHGMPVAHLLGYGDERLKSIYDKHPKINPANLVFIGSRSFEPAEIKFVQSVGAKVFYQSDVDKLGIEKVLNEAIKIASNKTVGFGMSIDMDGFDVKDAPAVGTPERGGIVANQFINALSKANLKNLLLTELVEFLPRFDKDKRTEQLVVRLIEAIYGNKLSTRN
uniref:Arginase n=1 Tax=Anisakis simplex TaxID=6269 RepID=A0A0M3K729_ANISI